MTAFVDKFALAGKDTGLEKMLKDRGIKNFIPVGVTSHNGVPLHGGLSSFSWV